MKFKITASVKPSTGTGAVKAWADVRVELDPGNLQLNGFSVVEKDGKSPWVGFPQKQGSNGKKYFPVVEAEGKLRELIINAILDAYKEMKS